MQAGQTGPFCRAHDGSLSRGPRRLSRAQGPPTTPLWPQSEPPQIPCWVPHGRNWASPSPAPPSHHEPWSNYCLPGPGPQSPCCMGSRQTSCALGLSSSMVLETQELPDSPGQLCHFLLGCRAGLKEFLASEQTMAWVDSPSSPAG